MHSSGKLASPRAVGREFVRCYYTILNRSPENLHCFYKSNAILMHDDVDPNQHKTISLVGQQSIQDAMAKRFANYRHTTTIINNIDSMETINNGLVIRIDGEISYNEEYMRPFSQSFVLDAVTPLKYYVQNDIFRYNDFVSDGEKQQSGSACGHAIVMRDEMEQTTLSEEHESNNNYVEKKHGEPAMDATLTKKSENVKVFDHQKAKQGKFADKEQAIMEMQSINLKNMLLESRTITKETIMRVASPPNCSMNTSADSEANIQSNVCDQATQSEEISENQNQLFQDSCILTIGNVVNPNLKFDDEHPPEEPNENAVAAALDVEKVEESIDQNNNDVVSNERSGEEAKRQENANNLLPTQTYSVGEPSLEPKKASDDEVSPNKVTRNGKKRKSKRDRRRKQKTSESARENPEKYDDKSDEQPNVKSAEKPVQNPEEKQTEQLSNKSDVPATPDPEQKTFADFLKVDNDEGKNGEWTDTTAPERRSSNDTRYLAQAARKPRSYKASPSNDSPYGQRLSPGSNLLQVFIGNIPRTADEGEVRKMFASFGRITRFKMHANSRNDRLPHYAFISYENIDSVRRCLQKRNTFYYPELSGFRQKLNVNGDDSIMAEVDGSATTEMKNKVRDLKQFQANFIFNDSTNGNHQDTSTKRRLSNGNAAINNDRRRLTPA